MSEQYLEVNGANLCYEVEGSGPYIVFVAGGNGGHRLFKRIRDLLVKHFTVVLYDRRGYFRSELTGPQDYTKIVDDNVDDLYSLMKHVTNEKFIIFGISASGPIVFKYLVNYPETVSTMFIHEPFWYLQNYPKTKQVQDFHYLLYRVFHYEDRNASMKLLGKSIFNELDYQILVRNQRNDKTNNWSYWLEHECCEIPFVKLDMDLVNAYKHKLIFLRGEESAGFSISEPGAFIAKILGKDTYPLPGGHIGFYTHSEAFGVDFVNLCQVNSIIKYQPKL
ncbi:hypothetical protein INT47_003459 [Mucor saturninus]|uniref:AB hydrolase-1 domain-containing protein n=1 Tax=Mucor saturninus TaxID=64648 RepID=A0A8H7VB43_9FUNG|nr:hypothetical protein INT47_003459 [Mucor saturninus]